MIIYGASGQGKVVLSSLNEEVKLFIDDNEALDVFCGLEVSMYDSSLHAEQLLIIAIGDNIVRKRISEKVTHKFGVVVSKDALVNDTVEIGNGCQLLHSSVVQVDCKIGSHTIINTNSSIDHDCVISDFVHIAPGVTLCGNVSIGEGALIGAGSVVLPGIRVGAWCTIGAGSVVTKDIPDNSLAYGNPCRIIK